MSRLSRLALWCCPVMLAAACSDATGPAGAVPFAIQWVEWPKAMMQGDSLLVLYTGDPCATLSFGVTADTQVVTVHSDRVPHTSTPCPLAIPIALFPLDTMLPLPALPTPFGLPAYFALVATVPDPGFGADEARLLGTIQLAAARDTTRSMAGYGSLVVDSLGCTVLTPGFAFTRQYAVVNPPALGGQARRALVGAHVVSAPKPAGCGSQRLVQLDYATVALIP